MQIRRHFDLHALDSLIDCQCTINVSRTAAALCSCQPFFSRLRCWSHDLNGPGGLIIFVFDFIFVISSCSSRLMCCALSCIYLFAHVLYITLVLGLVSPALALPIVSRDIQNILQRSAVVENLGGDIIVVNSETSGLIAQGTATDGSGTGYDAPALIWLIGSFALGVPLAFAGVRGWRLTLGAAIGLAVGVCGKPCFYSYSSRVFLRSRY